MPNQDLALPVRAVRDLQTRRGLPPHAYLIDCRIRRAQEPLADGKSSIKAISDMLRFSSTRHFATAIKKITGSPPSGYAPDQNGS